MGAFGALVGLAVAAQLSVAAVFFSLRDKIRVKHAA
jgi:hypothetical protein